MDGAREDDTADLGRPVPTSPDSSANASERSPQEVEGLLTEAEDLSAKLLDCLQGPANDAADTDSGLAGTGGPHAGQPDAGSDPLLLDGLLSAVDELGKDIADVLSKPIRSSGEELDIAAGAAGEQVEDASVPADSSGPTDGDEAADVQESSPELEEDEADLGDEPPSDEDEEAGAGRPRHSSLRILWLWILQSAPVQLASRFLTLLDRPFARLPKMLKDLLGYSGLVSAAVGGAGLAYALFGR